MVVGVSFLPTHDLLFYGEFELLVCCKSSRFMVVTAIVFVVGRFFFRAARIMQF